MLIIPRFPYPWGKEGSNEPFTHPPIHTCLPAGASLRLLLKRQCCQDRQCLAPPMAFPTALLRKRELRCRVTDIYKKALEKTWGASTLKSANGAYLLPSSAL